MGQRSPTFVPASGSESPGTRLRGWLLVVVRAFVFTIMGLAVGTFVAALPGSVTRLATPCADALNTCLIAPQQVAPLARLDITPGALGLAVAVSACLAMLLSGGVAAVLVWRRSDDWMALLVALTLVLIPLALTPVTWGISGARQILGYLGLIGLLLLIGVFPSGRFAPRWLWLPVLVAQVLVFTLGSNMPPIFSLVLVLSAALSLIAGQVYRYRRISTPVQRQQTKWAIYGLALTLIVNQVFWQTYAGIPALQRPDSLYSLLIVPDYLLMIVILAVFFGIAILRSRLFDIDVIIRRTLIYGSLTAILAGVYLAVVLGAQAVTHAFTGQRGDEPLVIVATTLLIAALFNPLRKRLQAAIDRRFYRRKYDSAKTLEAFAARLRSEVELGALSDQLVSVVQETMRPEYVSLWLRPMQRAGAVASREEAPRRPLGGQR